jgi:hypothetical protein
LYKCGCVHRSVQVAEVVSVYLYKCGCVHRSVQVAEVVSVSEPKTEEVRGDWKKLHKEVIRDLYSSRNIIWVIK